jgi:hypothetical protein
MQASGFYLSEYASLSAAITAIGATEAELIIDQDDTMTGNVTVPSNVTLRFVQGNVITTGANTLTVNGSIIAGIYQIFNATSGSVTGTPLIDVIYPEWFGATGDGVADDSEWFKDAVEFEPGVTVYLSVGKTYKLNLAIDSSVDIVIDGEGTLDSSATGANLFENDGSLAIRNSTIKTGTGTVYLGSGNGAGTNDITFDEVVFDTCNRVARIEEGGVSPYTFGLDNLIVTNCVFKNGTHNSFELACIINRAVIHGNSWKDHGGHCFFCKFADSAQQPSMQNIRLSDNSVEDVDQGNASAARGFYVAAERATITGNTFHNIASTNASYETAGVYTKSKFATITGNVFTDIKGAHVTNNFCIDLKGSHVPSADTGTNIVVSNNVMHNEASDDHHTIGIRAYGDRMIVTNNQMNGMAIAFDTDGSSASEGAVFSGNVAKNPPASHKAKGVDLRMRDGVFRLENNILAGYTDGIRVKPDTTDVDRVELIGNVITGSTNCVYVEIAAGTPDITKFIISGGVCAGTLLFTCVSDCIPNLVISDIDVEGITNKILLSLSSNYLNQFKLSGLKNHIVEVTSGNTNCLSVAAADDSSTSIIFDMTMHQDASAYIQQRRQILYTNIAGVVAQQANAAVWSTGTGVGGSVTNSGDAVLPYVSATGGGTDRFYVDFDVNVIQKT